MEAESLEELFTKIQVTKDDEREKLNEGRREITLGIFWVWKGTVFSPPLETKDIYEIKTFATADVVHGYSSWGSIRNHPCPEKNWRDVMRCRIFFNKKERSYILLASPQLKGKQKESDMLKRLVADYASIPFRRINYQYDDQYIVTDEYFNLSFKPD